MDHNQRIFLSYSVARYAVVYARRFSVLTIPSEYTWGVITKVTETESEAWERGLQCRRQNLYSLSPFTE